MSAIADTSPPAERSVAAATRLIVAASVGNALEFYEILVYGYFAVTIAKVFFPAARAYFTDKEDQVMLAEFWEFDRKMIHEKYKSVVDDLKKPK